jgi:hypothetical protein
MRKVTWTDSEHRIFSVADLPQQEDSNHEDAKEVMKIFDRSKVLCNI